MDNNITILLGILLTTSEILPYIRQIKGNGILEAFINNIVEIAKLKSNSLNNQNYQVNNLGNNQANNQVNQETEPLLENHRLNQNDISDTSDISDIHNDENENLNFSSNLNENLKKENEDINININSENVFIKLNTVSRINYI
jgi:hypothetical protein